MNGVLPNCTKHKQLTSKQPKNEQGDRTFAGTVKTKFGFRAYLRAQQLKVDIS